MSSIQSEPRAAGSSALVRGSVALLFAAAGSACADPPPDPWTTVPVVDNPAPADRLQLVADPIAAPVLPGLTTARFADDRGALLVLVPEMRAVRVDSTGAVAWASGRKGAGPGEYTRIDWVGRGPGDAWTLFDAANRRVTTLSPSGELVAVWSLNRGGTFPILRLADGDLVGWSPAPDRIPSGRFRGRVSYRRIAEHSDSTEHLMDLAGAEYVGLPPDSWQEVELGASFLYAAAGGRVAHVSTDRSEIRLFDARGKAWRVVRWRQPPVRTRPHDVVAWRERVASEVATAAEGRGRQAPAPEGVSQPAEVAETLPLVDRLVGGEDGSIWIRRFDPAGRDQDWIVFDGNGKLLGLVRVPVEVVVRDVRVGAMLGSVAVDAGDSLVRFRVASASVAQASCPPCVVDLEPPRAVLGRAALGFEARPSDIEEDGRGRFVVLSPRADRLPLVVDSSGRPVATIGRVGSGPGEFRRAHWAAVGGDTTFIVDRGNLRTTVVGPDFRAMRYGTAPLHTLDIGTAGGRLLLNAVIPGESTGGRALHWFDRGLRHVASFDSVRMPTGETNQWEPFRRRFAVGRAGRVISVSLAGGYQITTWSRDGRLIDRLDRAVDWASRTPPPASDGVPAPAPWLQAAHLDSLGRLWVLAWVADRNWRSGIEVRRAAGEGGWELRAIDPPRFQDTVVEVFDPALKRVLATGRLDESCRGFSRSGDLYCDEQNEDGTFRIEVRPIRLR